MTDKWEEITPNMGTSKVWDYLTQKEIVGEYLGATQNVGPNKSTLYRLRTDDGEVAIWDTSVLKSRFTNTAVGDRVKIVYEGKVTNDKTGREYHSFKFFIAKK